MKSGIYNGQVGWANDTGTPVDLGDPAAASGGNGTNDGTNLVKVTLYGHKDVTVPLDQSQAQGTRLLCQLGASLIAIPKLGARVVVVVPEPGGTAPGNAVIMTAISNTATGLQGNAGPGDLVIPCPGGAGRVILGADGSFGFMTTATGQPGAENFFFRFSPADGFTMKGPFGSFRQEKTGTVLAGPGGCKIDMRAFAGIGGPGPLANPSVVRITAGVVKLNAAQTWAGPDSPSTEWAASTALGPELDPGLPSPAIPALLAALTQLASTVAAAFASASPSSGITPAQSAAVNDALAAMEVAVSASSDLLAAPALRVAVG